MARGRNGSVPEDVDADRGEAAAAAPSRRDHQRKSKRKKDESSDGYSTDSGDDNYRASKKKKSSLNSKRDSRRRRRRHLDDSDSSSSYSDDSNGESETDASDSDSEKSEGEARRRKRRERRRREREHEKERRRRKEREREKKKKRKKEKGEKTKKKDTKGEKKDKMKEKGGAMRGAVTNSWGKYGILRETDMWNKRPEFTAWLLEVKKVNLEALANWEEKQMFKEFMEDHNTATFPSKKYYDLDSYHRAKLEKEMKKGLKRVKEAERTVFDDEEQRRLELLRERERQKEQQVEALKHSMRSGMAQDMKDQARLKEEMAYQYRVGNFEAAAAIQKRLDPDVAM